MGEPTEKELQQAAEIRRLRTLLKVSRLMNAEINHAKMIERINEEVRDYLDADRLTVFFHDSKNDELYSYIASGLHPGEIRIPANQGIAGYVFQTGEMVCLEDAYQDPRFNPVVDRRTGYRTRSLLSLHVTNRIGIRIGVVQALNKKTADGVFTQEDIIFLWEVVDQICDLYTALEEAVSHLVIYALDAEGVITFVSPALQTVIGFSPSVAIGNPFTKYVHPDDVERFARTFDEILSGTSSRTIEYRLISQSGEERWLRSSNWPIAEANEIRGVQGQAEDITERKHLEEQLRQSRKMESIGQLAGGVAHDFNNLLLPIVGYSERSLQEAQDNPRLKANLTKIHEAAGRAHELINQLLAFSRRQVLDMRVLDLSRVVEDFERILRRLIGENVEILTFLAPDLGSVRADRSQIQQILMNLAVNARDAMPQGGTLIIETANVDLDAEFAKAHPSVEPGPHVMLAVSDTGQGMDAATMQKVFEPFFTTKGQGMGTGLGLATVYGIVKQHSGSVWVYSELGRGTTFKIYLPRVGEARATDEEPEPVLAETGSETVLVVEDEDIVRSYVCEVLTDAGYHVLEASGPENALDLSGRHKNQIHLLLTDVIMPRMNGKELGRRLTRSRPDMRVLYMSGYTDNVIAEQGLLERGTHFLQKPFTIPDLMQKIRSALDWERNGT